MLCLLDEGKQYLLLKSVSGMPSIETAERMSTLDRASTVLTSQQALICNGAECVGGCGLLTTTHAASHVVAPLRAVMVSDRGRKAQETAATRVDFYTMVRGEG